MGKKGVKEEEFVMDKKSQKKVDKLKSQLEYHKIRGEKDEAAKLQGQIETITAASRIAAGFE